MQIIPILYFFHIQSFRCIFKKIVVHTYIYQLINFLLYVTLFDKFCNNCLSTKYLYFIEIHWKYYDLFCQFLHIIYFQNSDTKLKIKLVLLRLFSNWNNYSIKSITRNQLSYFRMRTYAIEISKAKQLKINNYLVETYISINTHYLI